MTRRRLGNHRHDGFQHFGNVLARDAVIAMPALFHAGNQAGLGQLAEMAARGLRRDAGGMRQFTGGERAAAHQRGQHVGAGRIADQRGNFGHLVREHARKVRPRSAHCKPGRYGQYRTIRLHWRRQ